MSAQPNQQIITYWLVPAEPARSHFTALIRDLATRFDAPIFEPHLTIYVATRGSENAGESLERALAECKEVYRLSISGIDYSDEFTKTVFVRFQTNDELTRLSADFRRASVSENEYRLNPHLSLIYKTMPRATKQEIAASIRLPFTEVVFDSVKAVITPANIKSRGEVKAWRAIATRALTE